MISQMVGALFLDPGLGKTSITLAAYKILKAQGYVRRMYVIAPLRVAYSVWPLEAGKWADFDGLKVAVLHGPNKEELLWSDADIFVINPEGLPWLFNIHKNWREVISKVTGMPVKRATLVHDMKRIKALHLEDVMLVVDESTRFKNHTSDRSKALKPVLKFFRRRYILTGTPIPNGLMDLYGQIYILDLGKSLGSYITQYRERYFDPTGFMGREWLPKPDASREIEKLLKPMSLRMAARDYLELPDEIVTDIYIDLPPKARLVYDEMEALLMAQLDAGEVVTAVSAGAATNKCRQIANGGIYREDYIRAAAKMRSERWIDLHDAKIEAVMDIVEELGGKPILIAYEFEHDLARLQKAFGKDVPYIGGGVSGPKAAAIERAWNRGELPVLLGQPSSMSHGLNLQEAGQHVLWHSLTYDLEEYDQLIKRISRQGNRHKQVFIYRLIGRNTVDEAMLQAISSKDATQSSFLSALNTYRKQKPKS